MEIAKAEEDGGFIFDGFDGNILKCGPLVRQSIRRPYRYMRGVEITCLEIRLDIWRQEI